MKPRIDVSVDFGSETVRFSEIVDPPSGTKPYTNMDSNLRVPASGRFVQILTWGEIEASWPYKDQHKNVNPYPQMITPAHGLEIRNPIPKGKVYEYEVIPDKWAWFLYDWFKFQGQGYLTEEMTVTPYKRPGNWRTFYQAVPGSVLEVFIKMTEAHICWTDSSSREAGARCPVVGVNLGETNWEILCDPQGGALLEIDYIYGTKYVIKALDLSKDPPTPEWLAQHPQYFYFATQWGKLQGSSRFAQLKNALAVHGIPGVGKDIPGIAMPLISLGSKIMINKKSCSPILANGSAWTPYKPR